MLRLKGAGALVRASELRGANKDSYEEWRPRRSKSD